MTRITYGLAAAPAAAAIALFAAPAWAGDVYLAGGANGAGTEWQGDGAGYTSLQLGYRFEDLGGLYGMSQLGYGSVDDRMLLLVSIGGQIWARIGPTRPYARVGFVHQHEESRSAIDDVAHAAFGIGDGIRHRAGGEAGLGVEVPFEESGDLLLFGAAEATGKWFPDDLGPHMYLGGGLSLGIHYAL